MKAKIGREISPKNGTMISLNDLRAALLLNALEISPEHAEIGKGENREFVLGFLTGWRAAMIQLESVLSDDLGNNDVLDLTGNPDADSM